MLKARDGGRRVSKNIFNSFKFKNSLNFRHIKLNCKTETSLQSIETHIKHIGYLEPYVW